MVASAPEVFSTEQVAALVGLDPRKDKWRVIKFAQGNEYGIKPSVSPATGSGSRRLYDLENVCEIALALRLLETGLRSKVIGRVIRQLRKKGKLSERLGAEKLFLVVLRTSQTGKPLDERREQAVEWVNDVMQAENIRSRSPNRDLILVPVGSLFRELGQSVSKELSRRLEQLRAYRRRNL